MILNIFRGIFLLYLATTGALPVSTLRASAGNTLTAAELQNGVINAGNASLFSSVRDKLLRKECVSILAIGGSVTCGVSIPSKNESLQNSTGCNTPSGCACAGNYCPTLAWPVWIVAKLNAAFPCLDSDGRPATHGLRNVCRGGVASDFCERRLSPPKNMSILCTILFVAHSFLRLFCRY